MDKEISAILTKVQEAGFEVAIVGGAVRDILAGKDAKDWDLTTNAKPQEILAIFANAFYNNKFGTVGVPIKRGGETRVVEITTYRSEKGYTDSRHPDQVVWGKTLEEDLKRRDFTINAMALRFSKNLKNANFEILNSKFEFIDPFGGQQDLKSKIVRTVGDPTARFSEDALRMIRAVRFATSLVFDFDLKTKEAIVKNAELISKISGERIRDELFKIIDS